MDLHKYREYCRVVENMVYRAGIWPHLEDTGPLYRLIAYYGLFLCGVIGSKAVVHGLSNITNVTILVRAMRGMIALYTPMIRSWNSNILNFVRSYRHIPTAILAVQWNLLYDLNNKTMICYLVIRKDLVFLDKELAAKFEEKLKNEKNRPAMLRPISLYKNLMHLLNLSTGIAAVMYYLPYVIIIFKYKKSVQVFQGKYPFHVEPRGGLYWIIFVFESSALWYLYHASAGVDNAFGMQCFRITGILRLATERFKGLDANDPNSKDVLKECVEMHQLVLRAKVAVQKVYGVVVVWNYLISAIVMCSLLWQANQMKGQISVIRLIFIVFFVVMKLIQAFIYAYFGSSVTAESEKYQEAIYYSNWAGSGNVKFMKELLIVRTQRTISLKACGFFLITMQYFEKICQTSISYFFLIQTVDKKN